MIKSLKKYPRVGQRLSRIDALSAGPIKSSQNKNGDGKQQSSNISSTVPTNQTIPNAVLPSSKEKYIKDGLTSTTNEILKRDRAGNLEFQQDNINQQPLLIEPITETYTNKSFIDAVDTQFQFFKFPPKIKSSGELDLDFDIDFNINDLGYDPVSGLYQISNSMDSANLKLNPDKRITVPFDKTINGHAIDTDRNEYIITPDMVKYLKDSARTLLFELDLRTQIKNDDYNVNYFVYLSRVMKQKWRPWVGSSGGVNNRGYRYSGYSSPSAGRYVRKLNTSFQNGSTTLLFDPMKWGYTNYDGGSAGKSPGVEKQASWFISGDDNTDRRFYAYSMKHSFKFLVDPNDIAPYDMYYISVKADVVNSPYNTSAPITSTTHIASVNKSTALLRVSSVKDPLKSEPNRQYRFQQKGAYAGSPENPLTLSFVKKPYASNIRTDNPYGLIYTNDRGYWLDYRPDYD